MKNLQIVDVREKNELLLASLKDNRLINLPLSTAEEWIPKIEQGELLKKDFPTVVMCHHGVRSMNAANYFGKFVLFVISSNHSLCYLFRVVNQMNFQDVSNLDGGIDAYAAEVDESCGFY
jgi:rhodanese-related sulfurtransferase